MIKKLLTLALGLSLSILAFSADLSSADLANLTEQAVIGDIKAQFNLGNMYRNGMGIKKDDTKAVEWWIKSTEQGFEKAQYNLAGMYLRGESVGKDLNKAFELYQKSANQGNEKAQYNLATMYANGEGVAKDYSKAKQWYQKSCDKNYAYSCDFYQKLKGAGY